MKTTIISWLLHHANKKYQTDWFYEIKKTLLKKYGIHDGYDLQHIEGQKCHTCAGTGIYIGYYYSGGSFKDTCNRCYGNGYYKDPQYNLLERLKFGKYIFHQPYKRCYTVKPDMPIKIDGYVYHDNQYWTKFASIVFCLVFNFKGYGKQWLFGLGGGWYNKTFQSPTSFISNVCHIFRYGTNAIPLRRFKKQKENFYTVSDYDSSDLPF